MRVAVRVRTASTTASTPDVNRRCGALAFRESLVGSTAAPAAACGIGEGGSCRSGFGAFGKPASARYASSYSLLINRNRGLHRTVPLFVKGKPNQS